jgi:hypothetical protein
MTNFLESQSEPAHFIHRSKEESNKQVLSSGGSSGWKPPSPSLHESVPRTRKLIKPDVCTDVKDCLTAASDTGGNLERFRLLRRTGYFNALLLLLILLPGVLQH